VIDIGGLIFTGAVPPNTINDGDRVFWRGDSGVLASNPSLLIDFEGGVNGVCPPGLIGSTINNDAIITTPVCSLSGTGSAGFILNELPFTGSITAAPGPFEAGAPDTNNILRDENREGEHIPFVVTYDFPTNYAGGQVNWANITFDAALRTGAATGAPLVLTNNRNNSVLLTVTDTVLGATGCTQMPLIPGTHFNGGDGISPLNINFAFVPALCTISDTVQNLSMVLEYAATSPEGVLAGANPYTDDPVDDANIGAYTEVTTLEIINADTACTGQPVFTQAVQVTIDRADLDLQSTINAGNDIDVCSVIDVSVNLNELVGDTTADNLLFNLGLNDLLIVDAGNNPSTNVDADITRSGGFLDFDLASPAADNDGPLIYQFNPVTKDLSGSGTLGFRARVLDTGTLFNARVDFDTKHRSPDNGGAGSSDIDRDYNFALPFDFSTVNIRSALIDLEMLPPTIILRDQTRYTFKAHISNIGSSDAVGGRFEITLPPEMIFVSGVSTPVGITPTVGAPTASGQVINWNLSQISDLGAGEFIDIDITVDITQQSCFNSPLVPPPDDINSITEWGCGKANVQNLPNTPQLILPTPQLTLSHDLGDSFCELCKEGEIHLFVRNTGGLSLTNIDIVEDLENSGLRLSTSTTTPVSCIADEGPCTVAVQPTEIFPGTQNGSQITITPTNIPVLQNLFSAFSTAANTPQEIEIIIRVERLPPTPATPNPLESIVIADLRVNASGTFGLFCDQFSTSPQPARLTAVPDRVTLPLRQPSPTIEKLGRNVTARQIGIWTETVFGGTDDEVIWRIDLSNLGDADLEDLKLDDVLTQLGTANNFAFHSLCPNETDADGSAASSSPQGSCQAINIPPPPPPQALPDPLTDIDFGVTAVDIVQSGNQFIYLVGTILNQCENMLNTSSMLIARF